GMVRRHYSNEVTVRLAERGCRALAAMPDAAFVPTGYLLTVAPGQRDACRQNVELGRSLGVDTRLLEPDQLPVLDPLLSTEGIGAEAHEPGSGLVDAGKVALAWFAEAVSLGVEVRIEKLERVPEDGSLVVVAAGCWSKELVPELPIVLRRIEIATLRDAPVRVVVSDAVTNVVVRPVAGGGAWVVTYAGEQLYESRDDCSGDAEPSYPEAVRRA